MRWDPPTALPEHSSAVLPGLGSVSALVMAGLVLARREEGLQLVLLFAFFQWSSVNDLNVSHSRVILLILVAETCVE